MKRRLKRMRQKSASEEAEEDISAATAASWTLSDALQPWNHVRCGSKLRGVAFSPALSRDADGRLIIKLLLCLANNALELFNIIVEKDKEHEEARNGPQSRCEQAAVIDSGGHR